jgi:NADPH2:quinone reductase
MRAVVVRAIGGPEALELVEVARPHPAPGDVLVRTAVVGVNFIETYQRAGVYPVAVPFTPGSEASGIVEAIGVGVTDFVVGDRITTAEASGTYAELFTVPAQLAVRVPDGIALDVAAAFPLQGLTAHYLATSVATLSHSDTVLVHAGAGGVGLLLTQLLAARGVRVLTTVSTPEKAALSLAAGAAKVCGYDDFREMVLETTGGEGVDVVFDGVGLTTFDDSLRSLRVRGTLVLFGGASGQVPPFDLQRLNAGGSLSITRPSLGHFLRTPKERAWRYAELCDAIIAGTLRVRIGGRYALEGSGAAAAHLALESRSTTGKLVLEVGE